MASGGGYTDYRNIVIYNWGYNSCYGGEQQQSGNPKFAFSKFNLVANYYKPGPATEPGETSFRIASPSMRNDKSDFGLWYIGDNVVEGNDALTADNWDGGVQPKGGKSNLQFVKLEEPWHSMPINQQTAKEAYNSVLEKAGATLPKRDPIDTRIIKETQGGYATYEGSSYKQNKPVVDKSKNSGIIDSQKDVGGWPNLESISASKDSDHDGMPDDWENRNKLNKENPDDRNNVNSDGYTMLEKYLNSIK
jgi:hypothetical protein